MKHITNWLARIAFTFQLAVFVTIKLVTGTFRSIGQTFHRTDRPVIVQFPLRARSDLEIFLLTSLITVTPDSMVLGTAAAMPGSPRGDQPATLFVHLAHVGSRGQAIAELQDLERRVLRISRGYRA